MRFSPQRRAIFRHRNCKKWSGADVFCTFSLEHVLLATAACNFSTSELQKVLWKCHFFCILTSKCTSRHSGVQFLSSPLTTRLRTRRFNEPFRLTRHTNHWKTQHFTTSLTFGAGASSFFWLSRYCIFFLLTLLHLLTLLWVHFLWWCSFMCFFQKQSPESPWQSWFPKTTGSKRHPQNPLFSVDDSVLTFASHAKNEKNHGFLQVVHTHLDKTYSTFCAKFMIRNVPSYLRRHQQLETKTQGRKTFMTNVWTSPSSCPWCCRYTTWHPKLHPPLCLASLDQAWHNGPGPPAIPKITQVSCFKKSNVSSFNKQDPNSKHDITNTPGTES